MPPIREWSSACAGPSDYCPSVTAGSIFCVMNVAQDDSTVRSLLKDATKTKELRSNTGQRSASPEHAAHLPCSGSGESCHCADAWAKHMTKPRVCSLIISILCNFFKHRYGDFRDSRKSCPRLFEVYAVLLLLQCAGEYHR